MDDRASFEIEELRKRKDIFFRKSPNSPLSSSQKISFTGLKYFDYNPALAFEIELEPCLPEEIRIGTSSGDERMYVRAGHLQFEISGKVQRLTALSREDEDELFVPFADATSGTDTYVGGRYLEVSHSDNGRFRLDFNLAYNPYCAYSFIVVMSSPSRRESPRRSHTRGRADICCGPLTRQRESGA
ncbi:MAG: DUF1684 domain-containing protein [Acidimicrobiia bacterium]